jgi:hypothetical protein
VLPGVARSFAGTTARGSIGRWLNTQEEAQGVNIANELL